MKKIGWICILAAFIAAGFVQKETVGKTKLGMGTDYAWIPEILNGKVKSVRETNFWAVEKDGKLVKGKQMTWKDLDSVNSTKDFVVYFDENGMLKQVDHFDVNNAIHDRNIGTGENGRYTSWDYEVQGKKVNHHHVSYDNHGHITGSEIFNMKDSLLRKQILTHDENGNYTRNEYFDSNGKKLFNQVFTFNDRGQVLTVMVYNGNDSLVFKGINTYDEKGTLLKQNYNDSVWELKPLKFDKNGNWVELVAIIDNGKYKLFSEREYEYY